MLQGDYGMRPALSLNGLVSVYVHRCCAEQCAALDHAHADLPLSANLAANAPLSPTCPARQARRRLYMTDENNARREKREVILAS